MSTDTNSYELTLHFNSSFSIGKGPIASFHTDTLKVIPGATLRGAIAAAWWRHNADHPSAPVAFAKLFDHDLLVTQASPTDARLMSTATKGCRYRRKPECASVLVDVAVHEAEGMSAPKRCWVCDGQLKPVHQWLEPGQQWHRLPATRRRIRSGLKADESAAVEEEKLFSRDYVQTTTDYHAQLQCSADLSWINGTTVRIGGERSNNHGRAVVSLGEASPPQPPVGDMVALVLTSPTILTDEYGAPNLDSSTLLAELQRVSGDPLSLPSDHPEWLRSDVVHGWHMRSRLPKMPDWALAAGSIIVVEGLTPAGHQKLLQGIGWRTLEGYGQLSVASHLGELPLDVSQVWNEQTGKLKVQRGRSNPWSQLKRPLISQISVLGQRSERPSEEEVDKVVGSLMAKIRMPDVTIKSAVKSILSLTPSQLSDLAGRIERGEL